VASNSDQDFHLTHADFGSDLAKGFFEIPYQTLASKPLRKVHSRQNLRRLLLPFSGALEPTADTEFAYLLLGCVNCDLSIVEQ
jgi:hypothetical protein